MLGTAIFSFAGHKADKCRGFAIDAGAGAEELSADVGGLLGLRRFLRGLGGVHIGDSKVDGWTVNVHFAS